MRRGCARAMICLLAVASAGAAMAQAPGKQRVMIPDTTYCGLNSIDEEAQVTFQSNGTLLVIPTRDGVPERDEWYRKGDKRCVKVLGDYPETRCFEELPRDTAGSFGLFDGLGTLEFALCGNNV